MPIDANRTVLIVDDDPDIRDSIEELLGSDGIPSSTAANGEEALRSLEGGPIGVILLDLMMPVMDGRQLVEEMRRRKLDVPVILLSAGRDLRRVAAELNLPAIEKPFDLDDLLTKVHDALSRGAERPPDES